MISPDIEITPWSHAAPDRIGPTRRRRASLATLTGLWSAALLIAALVLAWFLFNQQLWTNLQNSQGKRVENIAQTVARLPTVVDALTGHPSFSKQSPIQRRIDDLRRALGVDFIVVMDHRGIRLTHTTSSRIGHHFRGGDEGPALAGKSYISTALGTLGRSVRGFAPVRDPQGRVIGAVAVGVTLSALAPLRAESRYTLLAWLSAIGLFGAVGALLLGRRIKRQLMNMEPDDIAALVEEHRAVLDAVHEGLIVVDMRQRLRLINPAAVALFAAADRPVPQLGHRLADPRIGRAEGPDAIDRPLRIAGLLCRGSLRRMVAGGGAIGCVVSFRDPGELQRLGEELTGARRYAQALRAAQHDIKNRFHVVLGLAETGDAQAMARYVRTLVALRVDDVDALAEQIREPSLAGFLLGKQSEADELGVDLVVEVDGIVPAAAAAADIHRAVSVLGNLLDNAFDAVAARDSPKVVLSLDHDAGMLAVAIQDNGEGMDEVALAASRRAGYSTRGPGRGLGLHRVARQLAEVDGSFALYSTPGRGTLAEAAMPYAGADDVTI